MKSKLLSLGISLMGFMRKTIINMVSFVSVVKECVTPCCDWVTPYIMSVL